MTEKYIYPGCIHIHSKYSDGSGTVKDIVDAGKRAGVKYLIITDHRNLKTKLNGEEGYFGDVLVVAGEEISPEFYNHLLALNISEEVSHRFGEKAQEFIDDINRQGGISFITHPLGESRLNLLLHKIHIHKWIDWKATGFTGIELWSYMVDWIEPVRLANLPYYVLNPDKAITGPQKVLLRIWDNLCQDRRVSAIGGVDAHAKNIIPFVNKWQIFPYEKLFKSIRTYIITYSPLTKDLNTSKSLLYDALKEGRCFLANYTIGDPADMTFVLDTGKGIRDMGTEVEYDAGHRMWLNLKLPCEARMNLVHDGNVVLSIKGTELDYDIEAPGVYRAEVFLDGQPWIFTNPFYIRKG